MAYTTRSFVALLVTSGLAGSAAAQTQPPSAPPPAAPPAANAAEVPEMPTVDDPMLVPVPPAQHQLTSWRDALRLVHSRSTTLHISQAQVDLAEGQARSALAPALPRLSSTGNLSHQFIRKDQSALPGPLQTPSTIFVASLDLRVPVFNLAAWYNPGTAKERARGADLGEKDTERLLLGTVAQAAVKVITATRVAESTRVSLGAALSTLDLTRRRAALGAASAVDVLRAEQEVSLSRAQVVTADETLRQARETLGTTLGDTTGWGVSPDVRVEELAGTARDVCRPVNDLDTRADIRAAASTVKAAERDRTAVDLAFVPTVDAVSSVQYYSYENRSPSLEHVAWSAGAIATWLLYDGGDRYGQQQQRDAQLVQAREQLTQARRNASLEVTQADRAVTVAVANLDVATRTRDLAKESARLSRIAFVNGTGTSFDLVDNARKLREAEIDLLVRDFGVLQARITAFLARANCSI